MHTHLANHDDGHFQRMIHQSVMESPWGKILYTLALGGGGGHQTVLSIMGVTASGIYCKLSLVPILDDY